MRHIGKPALGLTNFSPGCPNKEKVLAHGERAILSNFPFGLGGTSRGLLRMEPEIPSPLPHPVILDRRDKPTRYQP